MRCYLAAFVIALASCSPGAPAQILRNCISKSGQSQFIIDLDVSNGNGQLRYQFLEQDVLYRVEDVRVESQNIVGTGVFLRSATGEVRGTSFEFEYDFQNDALVDGGTSYDCDHLQDRSLAEFPAD